MKTKFKKPSLRETLAILLVAAGTAGAAELSGGLRVADSASYVPTDYTVYRDDGTVAAEVRNQEDAPRNRVQTVSLPAGAYQVKDATGGTAHAVVHPGRVTVVALAQEDPALRFNIITGEPIR